MKARIQASTLNALMLDTFDETVSVKEFLRHAGICGAVIAVWCLRSVNCPMQTA